MRRVFSKPPYRRKSTMNKLFFAAVLVSASYGAAATPKTALPPAVQQEINSDQEVCRDMGGRFSYGKAVSTADLNHDGHLDYVYDASLAKCANAPDLGGSGGWQVTVFAGQPDGKVKKAFAHGAGGTRIIGGKLYLAMGGDACGPKARGRSRAENQSCLLPLVWQAGKQEFDFAPVSQKRPLPKNWGR